MNDVVFVEFLFKWDEIDLGREKLKELASVFIQIESEDKWEDDGDGMKSMSWRKISGQIDSESTTLIRLKDPFLSERMRISYIPDDLKDRYRK